jgi:hypothetical protein
LVEVNLQSVRRRSEGGASCSSWIGTPNINGSDRFHFDMMMLMSSNGAVDPQVSKLDEKSEKE